MDDKSCAVESTEKVNVTDLLDLGFTKAATNLLEKQNLAKKMMVAYEHYRFVTQDIINSFNEDLKKKTWKLGSDRHYPTYDTLCFFGIEHYGEIPPAAALKELKLAKDRGCFDAFEIAKVETVEVRPDPIIFGRIHGCNDRFFITQWDNDIKIEDLLGEGQG